MAETKEQQLISKEWTMEVRTFLTASEEGALVGKAGVRLPKSTMNAKAEAYIPEIVSLGPYHHRTLKDDSAGPFHRRLTNLSQMEVYKLKATRDAAKNDFTPGFRMENFLQEIIKPEMISKFEQFYDWKIGGREEIESFGWMMIVDAFFLLQFLNNRFDFMESQAGIKFQSFREGTCSIRFDKQSATLHLPQIIISDTYTEVLLRNLLALEFNDVNREKSVTQYVELMDCLIDTPEDVALLRKCHIIVRESMMITDQYVAKMWDGISRPFFFGGFLEHPRWLKAEIREVLISNYYKSRIRTAWSEFSSEYLSRPWKALALFVAMFVLFLTTLQTYCSVRDCQTPPNSAKHFRRFG
ncbi:hypothetical protein KI387_031111 [Taxus chinensis]|uniref:Uncharacterized protein n=1 Tax=Taxus chinensis TaxID=29808 RepID=A0AA38CMY5_TAXCH|nr:hypothetical protein KI387_031111 [Taxus chinensis]